MGFRETLKDELKYQDIKIKELSAKTGIRVHTLNHYISENGSSPLVESALKIADALNVSVEYLVTGKEKSFSKEIKPEVLALLNKLNNLSEDNFILIQQLITKLL